MSGGMDNDNSYECFSCGNHISAMQVHDTSICKRQQEILNEERRKATYAAVFLKESKMSPTPSDMDLANLYIEAVKLFGSPPNINPRNQMDEITLDDLKVSEMKQIAKFVKELRK